MGSGQFFNHEKTRKNTKTPPFSKSHTTASASITANMVTHSQKNIAGAELELALGALPLNEVQERPRWYTPSWHDL
jgi:hypothetical protein